MMQFNWEVDSQIRDLEDLLFRIDQYQEIVSKYAPNTDVVTKLNAIKNDSVEKIQELLGKLVSECRR